MATPVALNFGGPGHLCLAPRPPAPGRSLAAVSSVEPTLLCLDMIEIFDSAEAAPKLKAGVRDIANRWPANLERRLEDREWIACAEFTVADIMIACVLRSLRKT